MHFSDIDVMIDVCVYIYIYCLLQWNVKKITILGAFAECHGQGTRQRFFKKNNFFAECLVAALGKVFF